MLEGRGSWGAYIVRVDLVNKSCRSLPPSCQCLCFASAIPLLGPADHPRLSCYMAIAYLLRWQPMQHSINQKAFDNFFVILAVDARYAPKERAGQ